MPSSVTPSCSMTFSSFGASSPGSTIRALSDPSRRKMYVFSATGPTVNMRTSMRVRLSLLLLPLAAAPQHAVGVVAHRDVEEHGEEAEDHGLGDVLRRHTDEDREDHGRERGTVERAAPGGLLVEAVLASLPRCLGSWRRAPVGADGLAGTAGRLDRAGLGAAVLTPALLLGLGHRGLRSLTRPPGCGSRSRAGPRA